MVVTVRKFTVRHHIRAAVMLKGRANTEHDIALLGMNWRSSATIIPHTRGIHSFFILYLRPETETELYSVRITATLTYENGEQIVRRYWDYDSSFVYESVWRNGKEVHAKTLNYDVWVTGAFPEVKPKTRDFGEPGVLTDVVLVAGGQKFHVNKTILSAHSLYFRDLLAAEEAEYELEGITPKALQELLQIMYSVPDIYEDNVEELLEAARKFDVPLVTHIVKNYIEGPTCFIENRAKEELIREHDLELFVPLVQKDFGVHGELDDVVLKVGDQNFHVNRRILATHSPYFHNMFFGGWRESEQKEIELKQIDPTTFQSLLEIIYHYPNIIHEDNVEDLMDLNKFYEIQPVAVQCQKFCDGDYGFSMKKLRFDEPVDFHIGSNFLRN